MREANHGGGNEGPTADIDRTAGAGTDDEGTCSPDWNEEACRHDSHDAEAGRSSKAGAVELASAGSHRDRGRQRLEVQSEAKTKRDFRSTAKSLQ